MYCLYECLNAQQMLEGPVNSEHVHSLDSRALTGRIIDRVAATVHVGAVEADVVATLNKNVCQLVCLLDRCCYDTGLPTCVSKFPQSGMTIRDCE